MTLRAAAQRIEHIGRSGADALQLLVEELNGHGEHIDLLLEALLVAVDVGAARRGAGADEALAHTAHDAALARARARARRVARAKIFLGPVN